MTLKKTEPAEVRVTDTTQEEIAALEGQLANPKHSYRW